MILLLQPALSVSAIISLSVYADSDYFRRSSDATVVTLLGRGGILIGVGISGIGARPFVVGPILAQTGT